MSRCGPTCTVRASAGTARLATAASTLQTIARGSTARGGRTGTTPAAPRLDALELDDRGRHEILPHERQAHEHAPEHPARRRSAEAAALEPRHAEAGLARQPPERRNVKLVDEVLLAERRPGAPLVRPLVAL